LHTRTILRDRQDAFLGSQSLRQLELDARREIGVIFRNRNITSTLLRTFEEDWAASEPSQKELTATALQIGKTAKKVARAVTKVLPVTAVVKEVAKQIRKKSNGNVRVKEVEQKVETVVKDAVKNTVRAAAKEAMQNAVEEAARVAQPTK